MLIMFVKYLRITTLLPLLIKFLFLQMMHFVLTEFNKNNVKLAIKQSK